MIKAYQYRAYLTPAQDGAAREILDRSRELYNAALQETRDAYRCTGKSPSSAAQMRSLKEVREVRSEYALIHTHLLQDAITRMHRARDPFFRRCRERATGSSVKPGFPRFKGRWRYRTVTYKDAGKGNGARIVAGGKRIHLVGIGNVKVKFHRPWKGRIKQVSLTLKSDGHWYVTLICDHVPVRPLPTTGKEVGIDLGISTFVARSDGVMVANPRPLEAAQARIARAQHLVNKKRNLRSRRRRKAVALLAKVHAKVARVRQDFHHREARRLLREHDVVHHEDLNVKGLAQGILPRQVHDAGWGQFLTILATKAVSAGRTTVAVNPSGTSQRCSQCGEEVRKALHVRVHDCPYCGLVLDRDVNAARNVLGLGQSLRRGQTLASRPEKPPPRAVAQVGE